MINLAGVVRVRPSNEARRDRLMTQPVDASALLAAQGGRAYLAKPVDRATLPVAIRSAM